MKIAIEIYANGQYCENCVWRSARNNCMAFGETLGVDYEKPYKRKRCEACLNAEVKDDE